MSNYDPFTPNLTAGAATFTYANNRLNGAQHDKAGNITNMVRGTVTLALSWNTQGQLASVSTNRVLAESYAYDPLGRRVKTTTGGTTVYHVYDGSQCVADLDAAGNPLRSYTWGLGIDNLLAITVYAAGSTNTYYAVKDHLGSVQALMDALGQVAASYTYDAWGVVQSATGGGLSAISNRYLWQGREYSFVTGLYNFRARWYAPTIARWLSKDPIGLEGGLNLYAFCENDPVNWSDPYGLDNMWGNGGQNAVDNVSLPFIEDCDYDNECDGAKDDNFYKYFLATSVPGKSRPPSDWDDPGKKWKWDKSSGRYKKGGKYRHWHYDDGHNGHWDEEDKNGNGHDNIYPDDERYSVPIDNDTIIEGAKWGIIGTAAIQMLRLLPVLAL